MSGEYLIYGSELSPYSVKLRAYARYTCLPHRWILRGAANQAEFQAKAKLPLVPLLVTPDGEGRQDSTPVMEWMRATTAHFDTEPDDPLRAFLSALIEEYADEWVNKPMFHYRWTYEADQLSAAWRIAASILGPDAGRRQVQDLADGIRARMTGRLGFVGSSPETAPVIEDSFRRLLEILEAHLKGARLYLFGMRPCFADFGLAAQLYEMSTDPSPQGLMQHFPETLAWIARMTTPTAYGEFEIWDHLAPTLTPLLTDEIAGRFLPWSDANAKALAAGEASFAVELGGRAFRQDVQKYHARSLAEIRRKAAIATAASPELAGLLGTAGCARWLTTDG